jgi:hypothetical protein
MSEPSPSLSARRARLLAKIAQQRGELAASVEPWQTPLSMADHVVDAARWVRRNPIMAVAGGAIFVLTARQRGITVMLRRGLIAWQMTRRLRALFAERS